MALRNDLNAQAKADLTGFSSAIDGQAYLLLGETAMGDRTLRVYYYDIASSATADGDNVLAATGMGGNGRFIKIKMEEFNPAAQINSDWNAVSGIAEILNKPSIPSLPSLSFNNSPGRSVVSTTGATGFQISSTRSSLVSYSVTISTTVSLAGNSTGYVALQICSTNSATPGDWIEVARVVSGQSGTLVIGLTLNQTGGGNISAVVPSGFYAKILSVNTAGTPTYSYNSGQEVLFN
jgi:hypothetical protein